MPYAIVAGTSQLPTSRGWCGAGHLEAVTEVFGLDRFGKPTARAIQVQEELNAPAIVVGTKSAVGTFSPNSVLIDAAGKKLTASSLAEKTRITDHSFEAVLRAPVPPSGAAIASFWQDLCASAVVSRADDALLTSQVHTAELIAVSRSSLEGESRFWPSVTAALEGRTGEPDSVVFERRKLALIPWYLTALVESESSYSLSFDTIQHTSCITVAKAPNGTPKDLRGACAFQLPYAEGMRRITWQETTWSPIVSGFVVERTGS